MAVPIDNAIRLTREEFEILLFEFFKSGFRKGVYHHPNGLDPEQLDSLFQKELYRLKLKTK